MNNDFVIELATKGRLSMCTKCTLGSGGESRGLTHVTRVPVARGVATPPGRNSAAAAYRGTGYRVPARSHGGKERVTVATHCLPTAYNRSIPDTIVSEGAYLVGRHACASPLCGPPGGHSGAYFGVLGTPLGRCTAVSS